MEMRVYEFDLLMSCVFVRLRHFTTSTARLCPHSHNASLLIYNVTDFQY
jgi:hypothetical protein